MRVSDGNGEISRARLTVVELVKVGGAVTAAGLFLMAIASFFGFAPQDYTDRGVVATAAAAARVVVDRRLDDLETKIVALTAAVEANRCTCSYHNYNDRIRDLERDRFGWDPRRARPKESP